MINKKELFYWRNIKVQKAARLAAKILAARGHEVSEHYLFEEWINWLGVQRCDVSAIASAMAEDHCRCVEIEIFLEGD